MIYILDIKKKLQKGNTCETNKIIVGRKVILIILLIELVFLFILRENIFGKSLH